MATSVTLCLRHVPCQLLEDDLMNIMIEVGLDVSDYKVILPKRRVREGVLVNFGYGFLTCRREEDAGTFIQHFQDFAFQDDPSAERLQVETKAPVQVDNQIGGAVQILSLEKDESDTSSSSARDKDCNDALCVEGSPSNGAPSSSLQ
eukprot:TRINITY_DN8250_c0_g1_i1.p1 TRINITY_DN8250_c0_g1~~TRINITY_DN8250_c0_g1_i1.p1  ORF type:complete len:147 (+),score=28.70 TRINITY_DN8250_c0_g1_i1:86-526(+)